MKLHLGCGEVYLDGYLNIDYPQDHHNVQTKTKVDKYADITKLKYSGDSIDEIRLHHVFEHFDRATAVALMLTWRKWLKTGGVLRIEVPDFTRTAISSLLSISSKKLRYVGLRHIFGSQEAHWAVHYHGWSTKDLKDLFEMVGFEVVEVNKTSWKGTYNIEVIGKKTSGRLTFNQSAKLCRKWLSNFTVDDSPGEKRMLEYWAESSIKQLKTGWKNE